MKLANEVSTPGSRSAVNADKAAVRARLQVCSHGYGIDVIRGRRICRSCGEDLGSKKDQERTYAKLFGGA
jgi:hypothetical protein